MFPTGRRLLAVAVGAAVVLGCGSTGGSGEAGDPGGSITSSAGGSSAGADGTSGELTSSNASTSGGTDGMPASSGGASGEGGATSTQGASRGGGGGGTGGASGGSSGASGSDCAHTAFFQPGSDEKELSVGDFCDAVFICLPDAAAVVAAVAAVPELSCGAGENVFQNIAGAHCASGELVCQWSMIHDVSQADLNSLCEVTSLTPETDPVLCRVYL